MRLDPGSYLGRTTREIRVKCLSLSYTEYAPMQEQPWHAHEHPTFFIQLLGDHVDGSPEGDHCQAPFTITYHPAHEYHRSRIGPKGACGINIETPLEWFEKYGWGEVDFGKQRIVDTMEARNAGLRTFRDLFMFPVENEVGVNELVIETIATFAPDPIENGTPPWLRAAEERIRSHYRSPLSLSDLAEGAAVHSVYFARVFRKHHGCTAGEYIQRLRLQCAADLILSGASIGVAAAEAGFSDQFHLTRLLKRHYGMLPTHLKSYRRSALNGSDRS